MGGEAPLVPWFTEVI